MWKMRYYEITYFTMWIMRYNNFTVWVYPISFYISSLQEKMAVDDQMSFQLLG